MSHYDVDLWVDTFEPDTEGFLRGNPPGWSPATPSRVGQPAGSRCSQRGETSTPDWFLAPSSARTRRAAV